MPQLTSWPLRGITWAEQVDCHKIASVVALTLPLDTIVTRVPRAVLTLVGDAHVDLGGATAIVVIAQPTDEDVHVTNHVDSWLRLVAQLLPRHELSAGIRGVDASSALPTKVGANHPCGIKFELREGVLWHARHLGKLRRSIQFPHPIVHIGDGAKRTLGCRAVHCPRRTWCGSMPLHMAESKWLSYIFIRHAASHGGWCRHEPPIARASNRRWRL